MIDISKLIRNQSIISDLLHENDTVLVAKQKCAIIVPFRFLQAKLLDMGKRITLATVYPIVNAKGEYAVSNYCTAMELVCNDIRTTRHDGEDHYVFCYEKGDVICPNTHLIKDDNMSYLIYDEFVQKAKAPWYMSYKDIGLVMSTAKEMSGITLADTNAIFELIVAHLSRSKNDVSKFYRETIADLDPVTLQKNKLESVSLNSVTYANVNKMTKLMGGFVEDGLTSALVEERSAESGIELLLRKK